MLTEWKLRKDDTNTAMKKKEYLDPIKNGEVDMSDMSIWPLISRTNEITTHGITTQYPSSLARMETGCIWRGNEKQYVLTSLAGQQ